MVTDASRKDAEVETTKPTPTEQRARETAEKVVVCAAKWLAGICQDCGEPQAYWWFGARCRICQRVHERESQRKRRLLQQ